MVQFHRRCPCGLCLHWGLYDIQVYDTTVKPSLTKILISFLTLLISSSIGVLLF